MHKHSLHACRTCAVMLHEAVPAHVHEAGLAGITEEKTRKEKEKLHCLAS